MKSPFKIKEKEIKREWHLLDARDQILGRFASEIATLLQGKGKTNYVPYLDCGDYVVVKNSLDIILSGKKESQKKYYRHSGYPGGLRTISYEELKNKKPEDIIIHAVKGMLPKNKLAPKMLNKLYVFQDENYKFKEKFSKKDK